MNNTTNNQDAPKVRVFQLVMESDKRMQEIAELLERGTRSPRELKAPDTVQKVRRALDRLREDLRVISSWKE